MVGRLARDNKACLKRRWLHAHIGEQIHHRLLDIRVAGFAGLNLIVVSGQP